MGFLRKGIYLLVLALVIAGTNGCNLFDIRPSPGPGPTPDPQPGSVLFLDDFEDGADPAWSMTPVWMIRDGKLYRGYDGTGRGYAYVISGVDWMDYVVEVDLDSNYEDAGIILRCQEDLQNYVLLRGDHGQLWWEVVVNGGTVTKSESVTPGFFAGAQRVKVVVHGPTYAVYVNDLLRSTFTDSEFSKGMPGLASFGGHGSSYGIYGAANFDNFQVTALE